MATLSKKHQDILSRSVGAMLQEVENPDVEGAHANADDILCDTLRELGFGELVDVYEKVEKWYA